MSEIKSNAIKFIKYLPFAGILISIGTSIMFMVDPGPKITDSVLYIWKAVVYSFLIYLIVKTFLKFFYNQKLSFNKKEKIILGSWLIALIIFTMIFWEFFAIRNVKRISFSEAADLVNENKEVFIVAYYLDNCPYCNDMEEVIEKTSYFIESTPQIYEVVLDSKTIESNGYNLQLEYVPTLIKYYKGKEINRFVGIGSLKEIKEFIKI